MEEFKVGEKVWVVIVEDEQNFEALDKNGVLERAQSATSVVVAPVTVLEGGKRAQLVNGTTFDLLPHRTFRSVEEADEAATELAKQVS